jgi:hypothetical protein
MSLSPIDYSSMLTQLDTTALLNGLQVREQRRANQAAEAQRQEARQLAREQFDATEARHAAYLAAVRAWKEGGGSPQALRELALQFPQESEAMMRAADSYESGAKRAVIGDVSGIIGALGTNNADLATRLLTERQGRLRNSGVDDSHTAAVSQMIRSGDVAGARAYLGYVLGGLIGWDHAAGVMETLGIGDRADRARRDDVRADAELDERRRHNRETERQGVARVGISRAAGARADRRARSGGGAGGGAISGRSSADLISLARGK